MKKKTLQALYDQTASVRDQYYQMLQSRIQVVAMGSDQKEILLMNMTLEAFYLSRVYGGYTDADPGQQQWIAGPVRIVMVPL